MGLDCETLRKLFRYDPETGEFTRISGFRCHIGRVIGTRDSYGRIDIAINKTRYKAHRLAWLYVYGHWPANDIDHINGNPSDNRLVNLREATHAENMQNLRRARKDSTSGLIGAMPHQGKWRSDIRVGGKKHYLGVFESAQAAHEAYVTAKRKLHHFGTL